MFFNDPVPCPDPAERAVKMAMAMREAAGTLIAAWRLHGCELGFGPGIAQGYATLGQIGFSERSGYTAIGTVCNLAARLCAEAKDGQILVSSRIAEVVEAVARLEALGNLELKGSSPSGRGIQRRAEHQSNGSSSQFDRRREGTGGLIPNNAKVSKPPDLAVPCRYWQGLLRGIKSGSCRRGRVAAMGSVGGPSQGRPGTSEMRRFRPFPGDGEVSTGFTHCGHITVALKSSEARPPAVSSAHPRLTAGRIATAPGAPVSAREAHAVSQRA